jgi:hypothetical protein
MRQIKHYQLLAWTYGKSTYHTLDCVIISYKGSNKNGAQILFSPHSDSW